MPKYNLLTAAQVKALKIPGSYFDGRGLYLQVRNETAKAWLLKYSIDKKAREMGLGPAADISLTLARELRDHHRALLKQGIDPLEHRKAERLAKRLEAAKSITFREACARFIADNKHEWKNAKHAAQWEATLKTYAYPMIGDLPVQSIDTALVLKILRPIWSTKSETASRVRGRIESVIDAARALKEYVGDNPAAWKGNLESLLPKRSKINKVKNHPALPYSDLPAFMQELRVREGVAASALEFQILTASRPGNAVGARWDEIDRAAKVDGIKHPVAVWTIAGKNMKGGKDHKVPLSAAALAVLDRMEKIRNGDFVFSGADGTRPLSDAATGALLDRMGRVDIVPHGFRSAFRTWVSEKTGFPREVAEKALAHVVGDDTERAYDRGDLFEKRVKLMDAWAAFATSDPARSANVLPFTTTATAT
jgi:integrase